MPDRPDFETRLSAAERRIEAVETSVSETRQLAAFQDRDFADLVIKVDANRKAINALGVQTASGFANLRAEMHEGFAAVRSDLRSEMSEEFAAVRSEMREGFAAVEEKFAAVDAKFATVDASFAAVDANFAIVNARFDETRAGLAIITSQLTRLLDEESESDES